MNLMDIFLPLIILSLIIPAAALMWGEWRGRGTPHSRRSADRRGRKRLTR